MPGALIIGYGNPLRGDDGLGWHVADQLARKVDGFAKVLVVHQLTPELTESVSEADLVIFVDACHDGQPGSWRCEKIGPDLEMSQSFTHDFTPMRLLGYASSLFDAEPAAWLISAAAGSFDYGAALTPAVAAVLPHIVRYICEILCSGKLVRHSY
jgi:hydrogenase maturation protease